VGPEATACAQRAATLDLVQPRRWRLGVLGEFRGSSPIQKPEKNGETSVKNQVSVLLSPDCQRFNAQLIRSLVPETPFKTQEKTEQKQETTSTHQRRNTRKHQEKTSKQIKQQPRKTRKNSQNPGKTKQTTRTALGFQVGNRKFHPSKAAKKPSSRQDR